MPPVFTSDGALENRDDDAGDAIWNGAETPANAEVALNSPVLQMLPPPSQAMAKISFPRKTCVYPSRLLLKVCTYKREIWLPPPRSPGLELFEFTRKSNEETARR